MLIVIVLIVKKVLWIKGEAEVTCGFRGKGRVHGGGHSLNEPNFGWPRMRTSYCRLKECPL